MSARIGTAANAERAIRTVCQEHGLANLWKSDSKDLRPYCCYLGNGAMWSVSDNVSGIVVRAHAIAGWITPIEYCGQFDAERVIGEVFEKMKESFWTLRDYAEFVVVMREIEAQLVLQETKTDEYRTTEQPVALV